MPVKVSWIYDASSSILRPSSVMVPSAQPLPTSAYSITLAIRSAIPGTSGKINRDFRFWHEPTVRCPAASPSAVRGSSAVRPEYTPKRGRCRAAKLRIQPGQERQGLVNRVELARVVVDVGRDQEG